MSSEVFFDGNTSLGVYEHVNRVIQIDGIPYGGWLEKTGGGTERENQTYVRGAGGTIRGMSNGIRTPQEVTMKWEPASWDGSIVPTLIAKAATQGIIGDDAHELVEFDIVDQWKGQTITQPSITETTTVRIKSAKPNTASDGTPYEYEVVVKPVNNPTRRYGI